MSRPSNMAPFGATPSPIASTRHRDLKCVVCKGPAKFTGGYLIDNGGVDGSALNTGGWASCETHLAYVVIVMCLNYELMPTDIWIVKLVRQSFSMLVERADSLCVQHWMGRPA